MSKAKEWAQRLDGRQIGREMTKAEEAQAKEDGVLVIFGASDDLCEFRGVGYGECDCPWGGVVNRYPKIEALWCEEDGWSWTYRTEAPHEVFRIYEGTDGYCKGIVLDVG